MSFILPGTEDITSKYRLLEPVYVTRPTMPDLDKYTDHLKGVWDRRWLTNEGQLHQEFERRLCEYLGVEHLNLFCNGTVALMVALKALGLESGEVITTPFTFPATAHVLHWSGIRPVFCDIDEQTLNLDPNCVEAMIGPDTKAILAVHVYGTPCDVDGLQTIGSRRGLPVIYDGAHAFGVKYRGRSILEHGDLSMLSFHATKVFTTGEGGALISHSSDQRRRINLLKNFGIAGEETLEGPGINGKMNEFQAAFGLLQLGMVDGEVKRRESLARLYRERLGKIEGLEFPEQPSGTQPNYAYFPLFVNEQAYGMSRDAMYAVLRSCNVIARKYFYPLVSHASCYASLPSADPQTLPVAEWAAQRVLCLPIYGSLEPAVVHAICDILEACHRLATEASASSHAWPAR